MKTFEFGIYITEVSFIFDNKSVLISVMASHPIGKKHYLDQSLALSLMPEGLHINEFRVKPACGLESMG